jgi:ubiquitin C-terminal hydrolase
VRDFLDPVFTLTFHELVAFLRILQLNYHASKLRKNKGYGDWKRLSRIYCNECARELPEMGLGHDFDPVDGFLEASFFVYAICPDAGRPAFLVRLHSICPHMEGHDIWHVSEKPVNRFYECVIDCATGVDQYNAKPDMPHCNLLFPFGRFMIKNNKFDPAAKPWFGHSCLPHTTEHRWQTADEHTENLTDFIDGLPGYKVVRLARNKTTKFRYRYQGEERDIVAITWIPPWAQNVWNLGTYEELDCSFYLVRPFVFCVPQVIISNEAVPIGFILTPTERTTTYRWFHTDLARANRAVSLKSPYTILSDEGPGLCSFGAAQKKKAKWKHFFCHRHLITKFRAGSWLRMLATQILRLQTKAEYDEFRPIFLEIALGWFLEGTVRWHDLVTFHRLFKKQFRHGIWLREDGGVGTCSNHAEGFHGVVKSKAKAKKLKSLVRRARELVEAINEKVRSYQTNPRGQLLHTINELIRFRDATGSTCNLSECVDYSRIMAKRFGTGTFPCRHTADHWKKHARVGKDQVIPPLPKIVSSTAPAGVDVLWVDLQEPMQTGTKFFDRKLYQTDLINEHKANAPGKDELYTPDVSNGPEDSFAKNIVNGVWWFSKHRELPVEMTVIAAWILSDWTMEYQRRKAAKPTKEQMEDWMTDYARMWWKWAGTGDLHKCPVPLPSDSPPAGQEPGCPFPVSPAPFDHIDPVDASVDDGIGIDPTPLGLPNFGNTCFMNAVIQCLYSIEPLRLYFLHDLSKSPKVRRVSPRRLVVLRAYQAVQRHIAAGSNPDSLKTSLQALLASLGGRYDANGDQQDASEFLLALLDMLHEGLREIDDKPTIIEQLFGATFLQTMACGDPHEEKTTLKPYFVIPLSLDDATHADLEQSLISLSGPHAISDWMCPKCQPPAPACHCGLEKCTCKPPPTLVPAVQTLAWTTPPPFLIFQVGLFGNTREDVFKSEVLVSFPPDFALDSRMIGIPDGESIPYRLIATATHSGKVNSGHYIASIQMQDQWFRCNDEDIDGSDWAQVLSDQPYLFIYQRPGTESPPGDDTDFLA